VCCLQHTLHISYGSEQTVIIFLYSINWLVFITEKKCVYCAVRTGSLSIIQITFIHSVFCLTKGPKPSPTRFLHIVRSGTSSFNWECPLLFLRSSNSFLRLLPRLLLTSISPFIFPSITCFRRQFLRKIWPIQLSFRFLISCTIFLSSLTLNNASSFHTPIQKGVITVVKTYIFITCTL